MVKRISNGNGKEVKYVSLATFLSTTGALLGLLLTLGSWAYGVTYGRNQMAVALTQQLDAKLMPVRTEIAHLQTDLTKLEKQHLQHVQWAIDRETRK